MIRAAATPDAVGLVPARAHRSPGHPARAGRAGGGRGRRAGPADVGASRRGRCSALGRGVAGHPRAGGDGVHVHPARSCSTRRAARSGSASRPPRSRPASRRPSTGGAPPGAAESARRRPRCGPRRRAAGDAVSASGASSPVIVRKTSSATPRMPGEQRVEGRRDARAHLGTVDPGVGSGADVVALGRLVEVDVRRPGGLRTRAQRVVEPLGHASRPSRAGRPAAAPRCSRPRRAAPAGSRRRRPPPPAPAPRPGATARATRRLDAAGVAEQRAAGGRAGRPCAPPGAQPTSEEKIPKSLPPMPSVTRSVSSRQRVELGGDALAADDLLARRAGRRCRPPSRSRRGRTPPTSQPARKAG